MTTPPPGLPGSSQQAGETKWGIVLRLAFFFAIAFISVAWLVPILIFAANSKVLGASLGVAAGGLIANLLTMKIFDRRPFTDVGLRLTPVSGLNGALGVCLGGGAASLIMLAPLLAGTAHFEPRPSSTFAWPNLIFYVIIVILGVIGEELIFRGYAFQFLVERIGPFATVLPAGVIFGLAHASNPSAGLLSMVNTSLWGILLGYAFLRSHDLWLPIGMHFGWNLALSLFGVNLSGLTIDITRYVYRWDLLPIWSGGEYGPEGGLLTTICAVALFFALHRVPVRPQIAAIARSLNEPEL